ncbi:UDP-2,3-diacylglucosamine diphosphatase [Thiopseudomonas acetoxidans]|uniref:UDP-2,3-diacylglucosamine hydrolase n=1 Tax=Thiopseudomonas acetoxidans TaxID=3041622 RepID=A0ABT7SS34_9GAMM|nr:UDP-2,3-diacylglucosamine diphosphatase [Thiopseudomonas sp. CY1220]MDM7858966.1 UDP-2,3-diacylglucosamine diphosphatase [Thiopseudomonas sp. CY1220]
MILLISDLHLHEKRPDITQAFLAFLNTHACKAEQLYILGDFFDVWVGDDGMSDFHHHIASALRKVAEQGVQIHLMHGNRDFLIGQRFCQLADCQLLNDPSLIQANGESILLMHGDSLCTSDTGYQRMKRILRNPVSLFILRHLPLKTRQRIAGDLRQQSRSRTAMKANDITDVSPETVELTMRRYQVRTLIHGHTHRPAIHRLPQGQRIVLGDWDNQGWYVQIDEQGIALKAFAFEKNCRSRL